MTRRQREILEVLRAGGELRRSGQRFRTNFDLLNPQGMICSDVRDGTVEEMQRLGLLDGEYRPVAPG